MTSFWPPGLVSSLSPSARPPAIDERSSVMIHLCVARCGECDTTFSMPAAAVGDVDEVGCPICGSGVAVQDVESVDDDDDDEDEDEDEDDE